MDLAELNPGYTYISVEWYANVLRAFANVTKANTKFFQNMSKKKFSENTTYMGF